MVEVVGVQPRSWFVTANTVRFEGPREAPSGTVITEFDRPPPPPPYGGVYARDRSINGRKVRRG